jgi:hypothetical protein
MLMGLVVLCCAPLAEGAHGDEGTPQAVELASGEIAHYHWKVSASRDRDHSAGPYSPCIRIQMTPRKASSQDINTGLGSSSCGPFSPIPFLAAVVNEATLPSITVLAMVFHRNARSIRLYLQGRGDRVIALRLLSQPKSSKARLVPFRYGAVAFAGHFCLQRFIAYSASGKVFFDGGKMTCPKAA